MEDNTNFVNNLIKKINDNKYVVISLIVLLSLYSSKYVNELSDNLIDIFDSPIFKFVIFAIISYISFQSPAIGIILTIAMLVTLQVISNIKIKKEMNYEFKIEKFQDVSGFNPRESGYYPNPITTLNQLSPTASNLNLNFETPDQLYNSMISQGKELIDDSYQINQDLKKRWDWREKYIADTTELKGLVKVQSGINRLQRANQGEYNMPNYSDNKIVKYIKFDSDDKYKIFANNPEIMSLFDTMKDNYEELQKSGLSPEKFNSLLINFYKSKLNLLETVYKYKKDLMEKNQSEKAESTIKEIKQNKKSGKSWIDKLDVLSEILF